MKCIDFLRFLSLYTALLVFLFLWIVFVLLLFIVLPFILALIIVIIIFILYLIPVPWEFNGKLFMKCTRTNPYTKFMSKVKNWNLITMCPLESNKMYLFVGYPHGLTPVSWIIALSYVDKIPQYPLVMCANGLLRIPILRELCLIHGFVNAKWQSIEKAAANRRSLGVLPGGINEMVNDSPVNTKQINIIKRTGFIRAALQYGFTLVPIIGIGVHQMYRQIPCDFIKTEFQMQLCIPIGKFDFIYPRNIPIYTVVGKPINVEVKEAINEEDINHLSEKFYDGLNEALEFYNTEYSDNYSINILN